MHTTRPSARPLAFLMKNPINLTPKSVLVRGYMAACGALMLLGVSTESLADRTSEDIRSHEQGSFSSQALAAGLASPALPDPATAIEPRHHPVWTNDEAWITDIGTLLYRDDDSDGYFAGFSLTLDSDTRYQHTEVHAIIDVQGPLGVREFLHKTATFSLHGNTLSDEYRVDIELVRNYPAGEYDLFIDLIDSSSHRILDSVSARDFSNLSALPLESEDLDLQVNTPLEPEPIASNDDVRVVEYAGASGGVLLMMLITLLVSRRTSGRLRSPTQFG